MKTSKTQFARVWKGPLGIGFVTAVSLYVALILDGPVDVVSGFALVIVGLVGLAQLKRFAG